MESGRIEEINGNNFTVITDAQAGPLSGTREARASSRTRWSLASSRSHQHRGPPERQLPAFVLASIGAAWIEQQTQIDVTPCHDAATGNWAPGPDCGGFLVNAHKGGAAWANWCNGPRSMAPLPQCAPRTPVSRSRTRARGHRALHLLRLHHGNRVRHLLGRIIRVCQPHRRDRHNLGHQRGNQTLLSSGGSSGATGKGTAMMVAAVS